jgi:hypothetical protein
MDGFVITTVRNGHKQAIRVKRSKPLSYNVTRSGIDDLGYHICPADDHRIRFRHWFAA